MDDRHLDIAELLAYADTGFGGEKDSARKSHIQSCEKCRSLYISLQTLRSACSSFPERLTPFTLSGDCVPEEMMGDFLGGRLPAREADAYSKHIAGCDMCFERAAFFTRASVRMTEGVLQSGKTPARFKQAVLPDMSVPKEKKRQPVSIIGGAKRWIASPIPAYAFAASVLLFLMFGARGGPEGVVDISSDSSFSFFEKPTHAGPSFGFADAGRKVGEEDAGLGVERLSDGRMRFSWRAVDNAAEYEFSLVEITPSGPREVYSDNTQTPFFVTPETIVKPGKAYRWRVAGASGQDRVFAASGQFVFLK